jgi:hypothetical protein
MNAGNSYATKAEDGKFGVSPGVYLLTAGEGASGVASSAALPDRIGKVSYFLGMKEFICPRSAEDKTEGVGR